MKVLGTNYCMPTRWLTGPLQKIPPWLTPLVMPLTVEGGTFRLALSHAGSLVAR